MRLLQIFGLVTLLLTLSTTPAFAAGTTAQQVGSVSIQTAPSILTTTLKPGESVDLATNVYASVPQMTVSTAIASAESRDHGKIISFKATTDPKATAFYAPYFSVDVPATVRFAGGQAKLQIHVTESANAQPGTYTEMVNLSTPELKDANGLNKVYTAAIPIVITVPGQAALSATLSAFKATPSHLAFHLQNTSQSVFPITGRADFYEGKTWIGEVSKIDYRAVYPGMTIDGLIPVPEEVISKAKLGSTVLAKIALHYGNQTLSSESKFATPISTEKSNPWIYSAFTIFVLFIVGSFLLIFVRKRGANNHAENQI